MMTKSIIQVFPLSLVLLISGCGDSSVNLAAPGDIFFTELMPLTAAGEPQWLELYNRTEGSIDLQGCEITNTRGQAFTITDNLVVKSQQYSVVANASHGADFIYQPHLFEISPIGGLRLTCNGSIIDKMTYQIGAATIAATARSWQLTPNSGRIKAQSAEGNDKAENWCYTILIEDYMIGDRRFATPGTTNPVCTSVMPYVSYNDQESVLIEGIDWGATLKVAEAEFARKLSTSELPIWAIRDQIVSPEIAAKIAQIYFDNIEMLYGTEPFTSLDWNHAVWHFSWAISNLYRNGDAAVKASLQLAYDDAITRPETLERYKHIAIHHIRNDIVVMGDIHTQAHKRMQQLVVAPGNPDYLQSFSEYKENTRNVFTLKIIHILYKAKTFFEGF
ncbi:MAG: hypothetical protein ACI945_000018 [Pseudohongiellaceae bacterium]|jgi:hypothetical protein